MLISFSVANFLSFKESTTLSMERITKLREDRHDSANTFSIKRPAHELLKIAVIYGANASGKSNLLHTMQFATDFIRNSVQGIHPDAKIAVQPFHFSEETVGQPSRFEFLFHLEGSDFRYGFEISRQSVEAEWLYRGRNMLFVRDGNSIETAPSFSAKKDLIARTRANALFLSTCAQFNETISLKIYKDFFGRLNVISAAQDQQFSGVSLGLMEDPIYEEKIVQLLEAAGTDIKGIRVRDIKIPSEVISQLPPEMAKVAPKTAKQTTSIHEVRGQSYELPFEVESDGTRKLFALAGPFLDSLAKGKILVVDELDTQLHPILVKQLIEMFHQGNTNNAQLIFTTHDTNLLSSDIFRRDQIWFTEKNHDEATELYSLAEYKLKGEKTVRQDASYEKDYLRGRYGAIPFLGDWTFDEFTT